MRKIKRYGWKRSIPDQRDRKYQAPMAIAVALPPMVDLRPMMPPVYNQGELGSCVAHAVAGYCHYDQIKQCKTDIVIPSRLFIYYCARLLEGTTSSDSGAEIRDGVKGVVNWGFPAEDLYKYDINRYAEKPPDAVWQSALKETVSNYMTVPQSLRQMKSCLAQGFPIVLGVTLYDEFESEQTALTGIVHMPKANESIVGGHAVLVVGYDDAAMCFIIRNSWGADWGLKGYCYFPYEYLTDVDLCADLWTIRQVA